MIKKIVFYLNILSAFFATFANENAPVLTDSYFESLDPMGPLFGSHELGIEHKEPNPIVDASKPRPCEPKALDDEFVQIAVHSLRTSLSKSGMLDQINLQQSDDKKVEAMRAFLNNFFKELKDKYPEIIDVRERSRNEILALQMYQTKKTMPKPLVDVAINATLKALKTNYSNLDGLKELLDQCSQTDPEQFVASLDDETLLALAQEKDKNPKQQHGCSLS